MRKLGPSKAGADAGEGKAAASHPSEQKPKKGIFSIMGQTATFLFLQLMLGGCASTRHGQTYLIPQGYAGFVQVDSGVNPAPPLIVKKGSYVIVVPPSGLIRTSSPHKTGWGSEEFYYVKVNERSRSSVTKRCGGEMVWARTNSSDMRFYRAFIGTEEQLREYERRTKLPEKVI